MLYRILILVSLVVSNSVQANEDKSLRREFYNQLTKVSQASAEKPLSCRRVVRLANTQPEYVDYKVSMRKESTENYFFVRFDSSKPGPLAHFSTLIAYERPALPNGPSDLGSLEVDTMNSNATYTHTFYGGVTDDVTTLEINNKNVYRLKYQKVKGGNELVSIDCDI
jgi:hypothetical protein